MPLYPPIEPYDSGMLRAGERHTLYYEQCGNRNGKPVVFLHGGPGGGTSGVHRRFWDPSAYRIVLFDQRGCGRSTPHAFLEENTTWDLVADIELLRTTLGIERWQVFGGSWGSTLALAYAEAHPDRVTELVLRGIFLLRKWEIDWFYQEGASRIFPDVWRHFLEPIPESERGDLVAAYHRRLTGDDAAERRRASIAWSTWEGRTSRLLPDPDLVTRTADPTFADALARIECHYFVHRGFFEHDGQLLARADRIARLPCEIVQGRYDVVCPAESAWNLHERLPKSRLRIVENAGHSALEDGIIDRLVAATDAFRGL